MDREALALFIKGVATIFYVANFKSEGSESCTVVMLESRKMGYLSTFLPQMQALERITLFFLRSSFDPRHVWTSIVLHITLRS